MKRMLWNIAAAGLLLCAVGTVACWVRSYSVQPPPSMYSDRWLYSTGYGALYKGTLTFVHYDAEGGSAKWYQAVRLDTPALQVSQWMGGSGWNEGWWYTSVDLRLWLLAAVFAVFPVGRFALALWRRKRTRSGKCPTCGYDLRATPRQCPECGSSAV